MKKHLLKYYLIGWIVLIFIISLLTLRGFTNSSVIFKDYLIGVLVGGTVLIVLFILADIFTYMTLKFINKEKGMTKHDDLVACMNISHEYTETGVMYKNYCKIGGLKTYPEFLEFINRLDFTRIEKLDDPILYSLEKGCQYNMFSKEVIDNVVTALDELVAWSMKGHNNPDVLDSARVIENYLGVRQ